MTTDFIALIDSKLDPTLGLDLAAAEAAHGAAVVQLEAAQRDLAAHMGADRESDPLAWTLRNRQLTDLIDTLQSIVTAKAEPLHRLRNEVARQRRAAAWYLNGELVRAQRDAQSEVARQKADIERQMAEAIAKLSKSPDSPTTKANAELSAFHRACSALGVSGYDSMILK